mgnify:CR=1 FL=1
MRVRLFTIGYAGAVGAVLFEHLEAAEVKALIDVRLNPWSQVEAFQRDKISIAAKARGMRYEHWRGLGNPFRPKDGEKMGVEESMRLYRAALLKGAERGPLGLFLLALERGGLRDAAILCGCASAARCHRGVLAEELVNLTKARGVIELEVAHLPRRRTSDQATMFG